MRDLSTEPPEPFGPAITPAALARVLGGCRDLTVHSRIALMGGAAAACQLALVAHGFLQVTAAPTNGAVLLREHYDCLCVVDGSLTTTTCDVAALRRRLAPGGILVLAVPLDADRGALAARLHGAGFGTLQHRVVGQRRADGISHPAMFLITRAPRDLVVLAQRAA